MIIVNLNQGLFKSYVKLIFSTNMLVTLLSTYRDFLKIPQGLGITIFGMTYMFVHDGLVHRRFPVGPIAYVPYLLKVATAEMDCS